LSGNYEGYALLKEDDPYQECYEWFWASINMDETLPKEFLEHLLELCDRVDRGEEKLISLDEDFFERLKEELFDDISHLLNREEEEEWE